MRLVLARSKPSRTRMRAVASIRASTSARDRCWDARFLGAVSGCVATGGAPNASPEHERSLVLLPSRPEGPGKAAGRSPPLSDGRTPRMTHKPYAQLIEVKQWADHGLCEAIGANFDR